VDFDPESASVVALADVATALACALSNLVAESLLHALAKHASARRCVARIVILL
jgi:hypothetical protein